MSKVTIKNKVFFIFATGQTGKILVYQSCSPTVVNVPEKMMLQDKVLFHLGQLAVMREAVNLLVTMANDQAAPPVSFVVFEERNRVFNVILNPLENTLAVHGVARGMIYSKQCGVDVTVTCVSSFINGAALQSALQVRANQLVIREAQNTTLSLLFGSTC